MENYIIIGIITVIVVLAVVSSIKHFKGEGGSDKPKRKKSSQVKNTKINLRSAVRSYCCPSCNDRGNGIDDPVLQIAQGHRYRRTE